MSKNHCCKPDCPAEAEWAIWDGREPYHEYYVHACTDHVGYLLWDSPVYLRVFPIE